MPKNSEDLKSTLSKLMTERPKCGLIMPISACSEYPQAHWASVEAILIEALDDAGYEAKLVSQESTSGVIHQRIISNLYTNEIVVCDVSARNPNVMFELGMRLAFDKPTIIVKDDETPFSFDISAIEHITYPRSLKYADIVSFKGELSRRVKSTTEEAKKDQNYSTFLKHVSGVKPAKIDIHEIPGQEYILKQLEEIRNIVEQNRNTPNALGTANALLNNEQNRKGTSIYNISVIGATDEESDELASKISSTFSAPVSVDKDGAIHKIKFNSRYSAFNKARLENILNNSSLEISDYTVNMRP